MKQRILALLAAGKTYKEIVDEIGCAKSTISYHAKSVKPPPSYRELDWAKIQQCYDEGHSIKECRKRFGVCRSIWYNAVKTGAVIVRDHSKIPLEVLTCPERNTPRGHLRWRLLRDGVLTAECAECGISEWLGKPLSVHLHHINGVRNDNRIENLQMLCPNCHSQTKTYSGRNNKK